jgi:hypothetical protein
MAAGAAFGAGKSVWVRATAADGLGLDRPVALTGNQISPGLAAICLLLFASIPVLFAISGKALKAALSVVALAGIALLWTGLSWLADNPGPTTVLHWAELPERYTVSGLVVHRLAALPPCVGGGFALAAGALGWLWAGKARGLDSRFDSPAAKKDRPAAERSAWARLDAGEDPTL